VTAKITPWAAWGLCGFITLAAVVGVTLEFVHHGSQMDWIAQVDKVVWATGPIVYSILAALIVSRRANNVIGWLLMTPAVLFVQTPLAALMPPMTDLPTGPALVLIWLVAWFSSWNWTLLIFPIILIPLLFPTGKPPSARWRWALVATIVWGVLFMILATAAPRFEPEDLPIVVNNPIGFLRAETIEALIAPWVSGLGCLVVINVSALFVRYRRATLIERQQIKWLLSACALFTIIYIVALTLNVGGDESLASRVWDILFGLSITTMGLAIGISILRYRLWDIDIIIRRTLVYSVSTMLLALIYLGIVVVSQGLFRALTGDESQLAIVVSTLAIAALFLPLRSRVQNFIDRRFYRRKYDAAKTLAAFAETARDEVELEKLTAQLAQVVNETMQPEGVNVWLAAMGRANGLTGNRIEPERR
jgi:hypothetical protein